MANNIWKDVNLVNHQENANENPYSATLSTYLTSQRQPGKFERFDTETICVVRALLYGWWEFKLFANQFELKLGIPWPYDTVILPLLGTYLKEIWTHSWQPHFCDGPKMRQPKSLDKSVVIQWFSGTLDSNRNGPTRSTYNQPSGPHKYNVERCRHEECVMYEAKQTGKRPKGFAGKFNHLEKSW